MRQITYLLMCALEVYFPTRLGLGTTLSARFCTNEETIEEGFTVPLPNDHSF